MTRNLLLTAVALAILMALPTSRCQVAAQQSDASTAPAANQSNDQQPTDAKKTTDAQQQPSQSSASSQSERQPSSSAATRSNSQQQQPQQQQPQQQQSQQQQSQPQQQSSSPANANNNQQPNAQPSSTGAATPPNTQPSTRSNINNNLPATRDANGAQGASAPGATNNQQISQGAQQSTPAPARTDTRGIQPQERSLINQDQQAVQRGAAPTDRTRAGANAPVQGRANFDARSQQRQQFDIRSGIQFGQATDRGLTINTLDNNSVFFRSGLRRGDVLVSVYGRPIRTEAEFTQWIAQYPGERIPIVFVRDGVQQTIFVDYPAEPVQQQVYVNRPVAGPAYLGVFFDTQIGNAAIVNSVTPGTPAEQAGLQPGDMIVALNGAQVVSYPQAISTIRAMQPGERLDIVVQRGQFQQQTQAVLAGQPSQPVRTATRNVDVYSNPAVVPAPVPQDRIYIDRGFYNEPYRDRPLRRRLFD